MAAQQQEEQWGSDSAMRTLTPTPHADRRLAVLAARQHGVVSRRQLLDVGFTPSLLTRRIASGHLVALHRGVYAVGHARLRREGYRLAAVLAVGPGAVLSHRDAAALHGVGFANGSRIDVTTVADRRAAAGPIRIHGRRILGPADVTVAAAIPVTTVARTLVDLADVVDKQRLSKAVSEAERNGKLDMGALDAALARVKGRRGPGHARLQAVLHEHAALGVTLTRSELEDRFAALLHTHNLPRPRMNAYVNDMEVDALWPAQRLVVELDGYAFHTSRRAFERDREKSNDLVAMGYRVVRLTHRHVVHDGAGTAARLGHLLAAAA